ncbi:helix-turn-helix domain-containing protein [Nocardia cyriacigeorgica]|uniref:helix-turn-helix domain-containing protein n=1 Tax=Nocardia cyriacigeorgica TaxID=135487 RepID=UPI0024589B64|nr:helix-turn-helix domain-containing protein [Nocardia cyriacigeorgica]
MSGADTVVTIAAAPPITATPTAQRRVVWLWPGEAAYFGPSFHLDTHSAAVHTLAFGIDAEFTFTIRQGAVRRLRSVLIPARTPHRIQGQGRMLFFYLDADSGRIQTVRNAMRDRSMPAPADHEATAALLAHLTATDRPDPSEIRRIVLGGRARPPIDHRIRRTMDALLADPGAAPAASAAAATVGLSESRFLHLFTDQSGTSYRRYRLWARLLCVGAAVAEGRDLTAAAADAGFASASHFSDTFRTLFGLTATAVLCRGTEIITLAR